MKADNSKKFTELKELLEIVKNKIDHIEIRQTGQSASIFFVKDQLSVMNSKLDEMSETLDVHTTSLEESGISQRGEEERNRGGESFKGDAYRG